MYNYKILIFTGKGIAVPFILKDCKKALEKSGCKVEEFCVTGNRDDTWKALHLVKPDFVLSADHFGIDEEMFSDSGFSYVSWFVDNPFYFINEKNKSPRNIFLVSDRSYISELNHFGFDNVYYLPLATNIHRMRKSLRRKKHDLASKHIPESDISFVGTLGKRHSEWKKERDDAFKGTEKELLEFLIDIKIKNPSMTFKDMFDFFETRCGEPVFSKLDANQRGAIEFRIDMETSAYFREKYLLALKDHNVAIFGDETWKNIIPENYFYGGHIDYEKDVGAFYHNAKVSLNVTRTQIQTGINQRVLDIAASGGVFLTDYRETTQDFFECNIKDLMYHNEEDLKEKANALINSDSHRKEMSEKLYESVYNHHTYNHRMKEMLEIVGDRL